MIGKISYFYKTLTVTFAIICFLDCVFLFRKKIIGFYLSIALLSIHFFALIIRGNHIIFHIQNMFDYAYAGFRYPLFLAITMITILLNIMAIKTYKDNK